MGEGGGNVGGLSWRSGIGGLDLGRGAGGIGVARADAVQCSASAYLSYFFTDCLMARW